MYIHTYIHIHTYIGGENSINSSCGLINTRLERCERIVQAIQGGK